MGALLALNLYIRKGKIGRKTEPDAKIKLIEKFAVDQKKSLMLIQVEGQKVLLGVGPDRIERIVVFGGDDEFGSMLGEKLGEAAGVEAK
jgi:flagellar biogenesis protein FliO